METDEVQAQEFLGFSHKENVKRYFILDHQTSKMRIHHSSDPMSESEIFSYSEIKSLDLTNTYKQIDGLNVQESWPFKFILNT